MVNMYVVGLELDVRGDECRNERPRLFSVGLPVGGVDGVRRLRRSSTKWQEGRPGAGWRRYSRQQKGEHEMERQAGGLAYVTVH